MPNVFTKKLKKEFWDWKSVEEMKIFCRFQAKLFMNQKNTKSETMELMHFLLATIEIENNSKLQTIR